MAAAAAAGDTAAGDRLLLQRCGQGTLRKRREWEWNRGGAFRWLHAHAHHTAAFSDLELNGGRGADPKHPRKCCKHGTGC